MNREAAFFTTRRGANRFVRATGAALLIAWSGLAQAQEAAPAAEDSGPSREQCVEAHRMSQELKQSAKFMEAQQHLSICSAATCPGPIISDCGNWISQLEQITPSMVIEVRLDGKQALDAKVFVDDQPVDDLAHAIKVNPGRHVVRVELAGFEPRNEQVVLQEGQRMRLIAVEFESERPAAVPEPLSPAPKQYERPVPFIVYPLLAVGVAGLASFGVFSYLGKEEQDELESVCEPRCTDDDLKTMKQNYLVADISAGVGVAALLGAGILYFARPSVEAVPSRPATGVARFGVQVGAGSVGISMKRSW